MDTMKVRAIAPWFGSNRMGAAAVGRLLEGCRWVGIPFAGSMSEDREGHGLYCDPPFPGVGRRYVYNAGQTDIEERAWHTRLRDALEAFVNLRVVCRFYDHPMIRDLYADSRWHWHIGSGRKQTNEDAPEVLLVNQQVAGELF